MSRELIKQGYYYGTVADHGYGPKDGEEGAPYLAVKFDLETMDARQPAGSITAYLYLTVKAIEQTGKKLRAIGYFGSDGEELADGTKLRGLRCQVEITVETYNNEPRNKVGWIYPVDYVPGVPKSEASAKANAGRLSTLLKTLPATDKHGDKIPF